MPFSDSGSHGSDRHDIQGTAIGHVESKFSYTTGQWTKPCFVEGSLLTVDGMSPGLNYGQQVFEGMKARRDPMGNVTIFRPKDHARRMRLSAELMAMPQVPEDVFLQGVDLAVSRSLHRLSKHDADAWLYIRPLEFASSANLLVEPPDEFMFCVYVQDVNGSIGPSKGHALISEEFDRAATRGVGAAKAGGNYAPAMRWTEKAKREGYDFVLHLDSQSQSEIEEFSWAGFVGVLQNDDQITIVHSSSDAIIASITIDSIVCLARSLGWKTEKRVIKYEELGSFTEVFAAGTGIGITPIAKIHRPSTNQTYQFIQFGPCCQKIQERLFGIQKGRLVDSFQWCIPLGTASAGQLDNRVSKSTPKEMEVKISKVPESRLLSA